MPELDKCFDVSSMKNRSLLFLSVTNNGLLICSDAQKSPISFNLPGP